MKYLLTVKLVIIGLAVLVAAVGVSAGHSITAVEAVPAPKPRTLVNSWANEFAQDRGSIAWNDGRKVHIRSLASGRTVAIRVSPSSSALVLGGTRALWSGYVDKSSTVWAAIKMRTASLSDPTKRPIACCEWLIEYDHSGPYLRDGSDGVLVYYSARDRGSGDDRGHDTINERAVRRVMPDGSTRKLFDLNRRRYHRLSALDVDRGRIAFIHTEGTDEDYEGAEPLNSHVEIRKLDGSVITSFKLPSIYVSGFALDGPTVVLMTSTTYSGPKTIRLFDASSGKPRDDKYRVRGSEVSMEAGGGWIVYHQYPSRVLRAFRPRDSARFSVRTQTRPRELSIAGRRVAWVENNRIRAFTLP
jgi:hypothetical protein